MNSKNATGRPERIAIVAGLRTPFARSGSAYRDMSAPDLAKVVVSEPVDGQSHFEGRLEGVDGDVVLVRLGKARLARVPVSLVTRARLEVEF